MSDKDLPPTDAPVVGKSDAEQLADAEMAAVVAQLVQNGALAGMTALCGIMRDVMIAHGWLGKKQLNAMVQGRLSDTPMFKSLETVHGTTAAKIAWQAAMATALGGNVLALSEKD